MKRDGEAGRFGAMGRGSTVEVVAADAIATIAAVFDAASLGEGYHVVTVE